MVPAVVQRQNLDPVVNTHILVAKSFVRLITRWVAEAPLGYAERHWVLPA
jgi:hypothetical protein